MKQTAAHMGKSVGWLRKNLGSLQDNGFPSTLPHLDGYDIKAVDAWIDSLSQHEMGAQNGW